MSPDHPRYEEWEKLQELVQRTAGDPDSPEHRDAVERLEMMVKATGAWDSVDVE